MDERDWSTQNQDCWLSSNGKWCKCDHRGGRTRSRDTSA